MIRTVVLLREDLYEALVKESIERYGNTKNVSKVLNEILEKFFGKKKRRFIFSKTIRIGRKLKVEEIEKLILEGFLEAIE